MNFKKLNEELGKVIKTKFNESREDDKNALAKYLEIGAEKLLDEPNFMEMSQFTAEVDGENQTFAISSDTELIENNVAERMENLFDDMGYKSFEKEVIPHLYGDMSDYMKIDFKAMARDVIDQYGAGHELSDYDADTEEIEHNGKTYYIFREN